jgi:hypothetical protein
MSQLMQCDREDAKIAKTAAKKYKFATDGNRMHTFESIPIEERS